MAIFTLHCRQTDRPDTAIAQASNPISLAKKDDRKEAGFWLTLAAATDRVLSDSTTSFTASLTSCSASLTVDDIGSTISSWSKSSPDSFAESSFSELGSLSMDNESELR